MTTCPLAHEQPRELDHGLTVCRKCRHLSLAAIRMMPSMYDSLTLQLIPTPTPGQPVTGTRNPGINLDHNVVDMRTIISRFLRGHTATIYRERNLTAHPTLERLHDLAQFLTQHHEWTLATSIGPTYTARILNIHHHATRIIEANPNRTYPIGKCPECPGTLIAQIRPRDPLLPSLIICDKTPLDENKQPLHIWTADRWAQLGRAINP